MTDESPAHGCERGMPRETCFACLLAERDALATLAVEMREALQLANRFTSHSQTCHLRLAPCENCDCGFEQALPKIERTFDLPAAVKIAEARREVCEQAKAIDSMSLQSVLANLAEAEKGDG
jgi:hypothetical protein